MRSNGSDENVRRALETRVKALRAFPSNGTRDSRGARMSNTKVYGSRHYFHNAYFFFHWAVGTFLSGYGIKIFDLIIHSMYDASDLPPTTVYEPIPQSIPNAPAINDTMPHLWSGIHAIDSITGGRDEAVYFAQPSSTRTHHAMPCHPSSLWTADASPTSGFYSSSLPLFHIARRPRVDC